MSAAVGVDVGGTNTKAVRLGSDAKIEATLRRPTPSDADEIVGLVAGLAGELGPELPLGVAVAGLVDHREGTLVWAPHLPGTHLEFRRPLEDRTGVDVFVDNDANCAAVAEQRQGAASGFQHVLMLTLGTGIGVGLLVDGRVYRGRAHAGEAGHLVVEPGGEPCACGRRGCWETKVSGHRLAADARKVLGPHASAADLVEAAESGSVPAREAIEEAAEWLALGIENLVLVLDPEVVVVGGAAAAAGDLLLGPVARRLATTEGASYRVLPGVQPGILGADAGAVGAAICASEESKP